MTWQRSTYGRPIRYDRPRGRIWCAADGTRTMDECGYSALYGKRIRRQEIIPGNYDGTPCGTLPTYLYPIMPRYGNVRVGVCPPRRKFISAVQNMAQKRIASILDHVALMSWLFAMGLSDAAMPIALPCVLCTCSLSAVFVVRVRPIRDDRLQGAQPQNRQTRRPIFHQLGQGS